MQGAPNSASLACSSPWFHVLKSMFDSAPGGPSLAMMKLYGTNAFKREGSWERDALHYVICCSFSRSLKTRLRLILHSISFNAYFISNEHICMVFVTFNYNNATTNMVSIEMNKMNNTGEIFGVSSGQMLDAFTTFCLKVVVFLTSEIKQYFPAI